MGGRGFANQEKTKSQGGVSEGKYGKTWTFDFTKGGIGLECFGEGEVT